MPLLQGTTSTGTPIIANVYFLIPNREVDIPTTKDLVVERDLIGTSRTMINRMGFGSAEFTRQIWCFPGDMDAILAMRGRAVLLDGVSYDITFTSNIKHTLDAYNNPIRCTVAIRFKEISTE